MISGLNLPMVVEAVLRDMDVCSTDELSGLVQAAQRQHYVYGSDCPGGRIGR